MCITFTIRILAKMKYKRIMDLRTEVCRLGHSLLVLGFPGHAG